MGGTTGRIIIVENHQPSWWFVSVFSFICVQWKMFSVVVGGGPPANGRDLNISTFSLMVLIRAISAWNSSRCGRCIFKLGRVHTQQGLLYI